MKKAKKKPRVGKAKSSKGITREIVKEYSKKKNNGVPFAKGNEIWKLVQNPGRPRSFSSPEQLWEKACEYFKWAEDNPLMEHKNVGMRIIQVPHKRVFTWDALTLVLGVSDRYFSEFKRQVKIKEGTEGFLAVIDQIEKIIKTQKFEGAASGFFNATIISRDLGQADKIEHHGDMPITPPQINIVMGDGVPKFASDEKSVDSKEQKIKKK